MAQGTARRASGRPLTQHNPVQQPDDSSHTVSLRIGAYPGSFNPPTTAHLAVAEAALTRGGLDRVDLVLSRRPLGKEHVAAPTLADRLDLLAELLRTQRELDALKALVARSIDAADAAASDEGEARAQA